MIGSLHERQHLLEEGVQGGVRVARCLGRRAAQRGAQLARLADPDGWQLSQALEVVDDAIHDPVTEPAHLVGRQRQRLGHAGVVPGFRSGCSLRAVRWR
jgi:hypothetical protein